MTRLTHSLLALLTLAMVSLAQDDPMASIGLAQIRSAIESGPQGASENNRWLNLEIQKLWEAIEVMPDELKQVGDPIVGTDVSNDLVLKGYITAAGGLYAYWGTPPGVTNIAIDVLVAVSTNSSAAGYLGETDTDGVIRVDSSMGYSNGVDYITLSALDNKVAISTNGEAGYIGETRSDGVLRATTALTYVNGPGSDYITLGVDYDVLATGLVGVGIGEDIRHTDLLWGGSVAGDAGQNLDHDARYWAHGKAYNVANGGLWGLSIGRGAGDISADAKVIDLTDMNLSDGSTIYLDWNDGWTKDALGNFSMNWKNRLLTDSAGSNVLDWENLSLSVDSIVVGTTSPTNRITLLPDSISADLSGEVDIRGGGDVVLISDGAGNASFGTTGSGFAALGAGGDVRLQPTGDLVIGSNAGVTIADGGNNIMEKGIFVNDGVWTVQTISYIAPGGTTNTMTVLAKP